VKSVLDDLRREDRAALLTLTPAARVALALALGERDLEAFRAARSLGREDAERELERQRQRGRRRSRAIESVIECRCSNE
jgi:hypothetical protein